MINTWVKSAAFAFFFFAMSGANAQNSKTINLRCYWEGDGYPEQFEAAYSRVLENNIQEGMGTYTRDPEAGAKSIKSNAIFRLLRGIDGKGPGRLLIYPEPRTGRDKKIPSHRLIVRVDKNLDPETEAVLGSNYRLVYRAFRVSQDDPITSPVPYTEVQAGTCYGIF
jgi:hypothetical protein